MAFRLAYLHLTLPIVKVTLTVRHVKIVNIWQMVTDRANITLASDIMSHVGFRLAYLELTLTYSKGQHGRGNGVSHNILTLSC